MKLQVALDTLTVEECISLLEEIKEYVDIAEVGTPIIIKEGLRLVRSLKEQFPTIRILADTKIMDAGELEAEYAFEAGADIVTVLGASHDSTILGALKSARKYNGEVMIDMIAVKDLKKRVSEVDQMGVHYICVHTAFDIQDTGRNSLDDLKLVNATVKHAKSAIAGGINLQLINKVVKQKPEIIVCGGSICNAQDPVETAKALKERMRIA